MTFEILEKKKAGGAAALSLGSELIITHGAHYNEKFEDLDEVLANFVAPYMRNFNAVVNHRKFAPGSLEDIQNAALSAVCEPLQPPPPPPLPSGALQALEAWKTFMPPGYRKSAYVKQHLFSSFQGR